MSRVSVVVLTLLGYMSCRATEELRLAKRLFLQSSLHPFATVVTGMEGIVYETMDDLYEQAPDFDALQEAIAQRLLSAEDCVYAVCGAADAFLPVLNGLKREGDSVSVFRSVTLAQAAFPESFCCNRTVANALPPVPDMTRDLIIEEMDSPLRAGECKLALSEFYPDETRVTVAQFGPDGSFTHKTVALFELDRQKHYDAVTTVLIPPVPYEKKERYGTEDLIKTLEILRAPGGCPWDREQTHTTLTQALIEEAYETVDAIERDDIDALEEELGDVLLQVGMHAVIGGECGEFSFRDVSTRIVRKMIDRHPHVFGDAKADTVGEVLTRWDAIKKDEKHQTTQTEVLESVPKCFPALLRARKVQKRAASVGFDWTDALSAFEKIPEETAELKAAMEQGSNVEEELGDLLFSVVNVARLLGTEPEDLLKRATDKFIRRFARMEEQSIAQGHKLESLSFEEQNRLWDEVKAEEI